MSPSKVDLLIVGAGPVGLMAAYLAKVSGLNLQIIDKSLGPTKVGRADALNARSLQFFKILGFKDELLNQGLKCSTSSIWKDGKFASRNSSWWDNLKGCFDKHFLMLGQSHIESLLIEKLNALGVSVLRNTSLEDLKVQDKSSVASLSDGNTVEADYILGADGPRSMIRQILGIPFNVIRPNISWSVLDGVFEHDFPRGAEITVFQGETADIAWIPRENNLDRFYIRKEVGEKLDLEEALARINRVSAPHKIQIKEVVWFSEFNVKESVAGAFSYLNKVFLLGDAGHIHSVNGGQGLNTGLADAFNLIWKIALSKNTFSDSTQNSQLLNSYDLERRTVAKTVIDSSGDLVRTTKYSEGRQHAEEYLSKIERYSGNITGMGIEYSGNGFVGKRVFDFKFSFNGVETDLYSELNYKSYSLLNFTSKKYSGELPSNTKIFDIKLTEKTLHEMPELENYKDKILLVRPDSYIEKELS